VARPAGLEMARGDADGSPLLCPISAKMQGRPAGFRGNPAETLP
jgi:hypothetical protein